MNYHVKHKGINHNLHIFYTFDNSSAFCVAKLPTFWDYLKAFYTFYETYLKFMISTVFSDFNYFLIKNSNYFEPFKFIFLKFVKNSKKIQHSLKDYKAYNMFCISFFNTFYVLIRIFVLNIVDAHIYPKQTHNKN